MADNLNRIMLDDEIVESVAGGKFRYTSNPVAGCKCWDSENPDVKYTFTNVAQFLDYVNSYGGNKEDSKIKLLSSILHN